MLKSDSGIDLYMYILISEIILCVSNFKKLHNYYLEIIAIIEMLLNYSGINSQLYIHASDTIFVFQFSKFINALLFRDKSND